MEFLSGSLWLKKPIRLPPYNIYILISNHIEWKKNVSKLNICTKAREHNNDSHKYSCVKLSCYQHIFSSLTYLLPSSAHKKKTYIHMLCGVMVRKNCSFKFFLYISHAHTHRHEVFCAIIILFSVLLLSTPKLCVSLSIAF